jgi:hypothetical protein|tara:strand:- start:366 stop:587 length:222 start_codon:yes stop_codon:yes gene_type:complete
MTERESNFIKLAEKRVNNAIKQLRLVGNLSNKSNYTYSDSQANKIINTLNAELNEMKVRFKMHMKNKSKEFKI